jgi:acyl carrier protein
MNDTFERVKALMVGEFQLDPASVTPATPLTELGVDSLAALEFVFVLEDAFGITIDATTDLRGGRVEDVVNAVNRAQSPQLAMPAAA